MTETMQDLVKSWAASGAALGAAWWGVVNDVLAALLILSAIIYNVLKIVLELDARTAKEASGKRKRKKK